MKAIKVFSEESEEHKKLELAAAIMTFLSPNNRRYRVDETWYDYDANIAWTTIIGETGLDVFRTVQALSPADQKAVLEAETVWEIGKAASKALGKLPTDKAKEE